MKKLGILVGLAGALAAPNLFAGMTVSLQNDTANYSYGDGGEFRATPNADLSSQIAWGAYSTATKGANSFQTFCIEYNEEFYVGQTYNVSISDRAMYGSQAPSGDALSIGTAWLYSQFAAGTLANYTYAFGKSRTISANALQQAIWWLEGEGGTKNALISAAEQALNLTDDSIKYDSQGAYGVKALNLGDPGKVQDQLVIVVPEPATMVAGLFLVIPFGFSGLRILRQRSTRA